MTITLHYATYPAHALGETNQLTMIHGGCGPQDPTGPQARLAADTLASIAESLAGTSRTAISGERSLLAPVAGSLSMAEERSLRGALALEAFWMGWSSDTISEALSKVQLARPTPFLQAVREIAK